jgi:cold shock CspA family protein
MAFMLLSAAAARSARVSSVRGSRCTANSWRVASFSTVDDDGADDLSRNQYTGTVKFYDRKKAYGFVAVDDDAIMEDLFVHRADMVIVGGERYREDGEIRDIRHPYLNRLERIRFDISSSPNGKKRAANITDESGAALPRFRDTYLENSVKHIKMKFGVEAYDHLVQGNVEEVMKLFESTQLEMANNERHMLDAELPTPINYNK